MCVYVGGCVCVCVCVCVCMSVCVCVCVLEWDGRWGGCLCMCDGQLVFIAQSL